MDVTEQVAYWKQSAEEDRIVDRELVGSGHTRHGLFFAHLALAKLLKARVCLVTQNVPPRIHNLIRLAQLAQLQLTDEQTDVLAVLNAFHLEGRYPQSLTSAPTAEEAQEYRKRAEETYLWLTNQL